MTDPKVAVHIDITNNAQRHECSNLFFRRKKQTCAVLEIAGVVNTIAATCII